MTIHVHPSSSELLAAIHEPDRATLVLEHVGNCLACRVRLYRLREATEPEPIGEGTFQRIMAASTPLPEVIADLVAAGTGGQPHPNEVWRIGRDEALLAWVRRVFDDGVAEVVPLVLDVELADQHSVLIGADATPVATEMAALVALRTHIHVGAFLNRVGDLDISREVAEIMTAVQEGRRPSGIPVGPPIEDDNDQRLEYRQALRDLLAPLSPSAWLDDEADIEPLSLEAADESAESTDGGIDSIKAQLSERLNGIRVVDSSPLTVAAGSYARATRILNITYLDATVVVAKLHVDSEDAAEPDDSSLAAACASFLESEPGADAIAIAVAQAEWPTRLFPSSYLRTAHQLPTGAIAGPEPTLVGLGLVDTLCKHLDGTAPAWELLDEPASVKIGATSIHHVAIGHAASSIEKITKQGKAARQAAKKTAWQSLPDDLDERVAQFVTAAAISDVADALADLLGEPSGD